MSSSAKQKLTKPEIKKQYKQRFEILIRYLVLAAENKRFVTYGEITKVIGISLEMTGEFCAHVGDFCRSQNKRLPLLNSLVISSDGMPESGYFDWLGTKTKKDYAAWGQHVQECFKWFKTSQRPRFKNIGDMGTRVDTYLK